MRDISGEAVIGLLGTILGARAVSRMSSGGPGPGGGASPGASVPPPPPCIDAGRSLAKMTLATFATVAALALLLGAWLFPQHVHHGEG